MPNYERLYDAALLANDECREYAAQLKSERDRFQTRATDLEHALEEIAQKGGVGPYEPPRQGHRPDPWYNSLVRCGEIARNALKGN